MHRSGFRFPVIALAVGLLGGCLGACPVSCSGTVSQADHARAEEAVLQFHVRLNKGDYDGIWETTSEELRGASSREDFRALLEAVHRKLGAEQYTATKTRSFMGRMGAMHLTLVQETKFNFGKGIETFVFKVERDRVTLSGYHINSADLILR